MQKDRTGEVTSLLGNQAIIIKYVVTALLAEKSKEVSVMKHSLSKVIFPIILSALLLAGCQSVSTSVSSSTPSHPSTVTTPVPPSPASEESSPVATDTPEQSPIDTTKEYSDLSFLTTDQQELYRVAYDAKDGLYGMGDNLMYLWGYRPVLDDNEAVVYIDEDYVLYDANFYEFSNHIHQIFTDSFLANSDYSVKFIDYDGDVAVNYSLKKDMVYGTTIQVNEAFPDTYRLVCSSENSIDFTLISHYDRNGWNGQNDSIDVYTIEYPIRMIKLSDGWRIDEFHTTMFG